MNGKSGSREELPGESARGLVLRYCGIASKPHPPKKKDIARSLGVSPSCVTRLAREAEKRGYLRVSFHPPREKTLEDELRDLLRARGIREVVVTAGDATTVGPLAARFFEERARDGETIVLDGGKTVAAFVDSLANDAFSNLRLVPLVADPASYESSSYELISRMGIKNPSQVKCGKLPHWTGKDLEKTRAQVRRWARGAHFVVLGVGPWQPRFTALQFVRHLGLDARELLARYADRVCGVVGYCGLRHDGSYVEVPEVDERLPRALQFKDLKALAASRRCTSMLLAATRHKLDAVMAALAARVCNALLIDGELAGSLLAGCRGRG